MGEIKEDFYKQLLEKSKLFMSQIRYAERHMLAYQKAIGKPLLNEKQFEKTVCKALLSMQAGLSFETVIELTWPTESMFIGCTVDKSVGPGFEQTQKEFNGDFKVIYRHHSDSNY